MASTAAWSRTSADCLTQKKNGQNILRSEMGNGGQGGMYGAWQAAFPHTPYTDTNYP